jgi:hypothetical protein
MPDVSLVYWDYYHTREEVYDGMFRCHEQFGRESCSPAESGRGAVCCQCGPYVRHNDTCSEIMRHPSYRDGFATLWSDDGCETNHFMALSLLSIFSENATPAVIAAKTGYGTCACFPAGSHARLGRS